MYETHGIKLVINNRKIFRKSQDTWKLNNTLLNNMDQRSQNTLNKMK